MIFYQKIAARSLMVGIAVVLGLLFVSSDFYGCVPSAASELSPSPDPLWVQGKVLCEAGEYTKSLRFLTDLLGHTEDQGERGIILFWMGKAWEGMGDFDRAQDSYTAALRENPGLPELSRILAVHQGKATPLWDHVPSPEEPLSLPKASKPPYNEYNVVQPPVLPPPVVQMPAPLPSAPQFSYAPAPQIPEMPQPLPASPPQAIQESNFGALPQPFPESLPIPVAAPASPAGGTPPEWIPGPLPVQDVPQQPAYMPPPPQGGVEMPPFTPSENLSSPPQLPLGTTSPGLAPAPPLPMQKAPEPVYIPPPSREEGKTGEPLSPPENLSPPFSPLPAVFDMGNRQPLSGDFQGARGDISPPAPVYVPPAPEKLPLLSGDIPPAPEKEQEKLPEKPVYIPPPPSKEEEM